MASNTHSRYYGIEVLTLDGRLVVEQRELPERVTKGAILHTVVGRETLDMLARRYYGREDLWWRIADANPPRFPLELEAGDTIVIPALAASTRTRRGKR